MKLPLLTYILYLLGLGVFMSTMKEGNSTVQMYEMLFAFGCWHTGRLIKRRSKAMK
ncbi:MAG: hypothetical protein KGI29_00090 [Pseudomonadota bacterium]|nr:hypothetical protein [Pseudomonadota bacterium]MDE3037298.1 hypothetical protein [Pseudomonadota bacterium]